MVLTVGGKFRGFFNSVVVERWSNEVLMICARICVVYCSGMCSLFVGVAWLE